MARMKKVPNPDFDPTKDEELVVEQSKIKKLSGEELCKKLFGKTLSTETVFVDGLSIAFVLQALTDTVWTHIRQTYNNSNGEIPEDRQLEYLKTIVKFGLINIENEDLLKDSDDKIISYVGSSVNILGTPIACCDDSFLELFRSKGLIANLATIILDISELIATEQNRIEFFRPSRRTS
jgi:hypothetical protein